MAFLTIEPNRQYIPVAFCTRALEWSEPFMYCDASHIKIKKVRKIFKKMKPSNFPSKYFSMKLYLPQNDFKPIKSYIQISDYVSDDNDLIIIQFHKDHDKHTIQSKPFSLNELEMFLNSCDQFEKKFREGNKK